MGRIGGLENYWGCLKFFDVRLELIRMEGRGAWFLKRQGLTIVGKSNSMAM